MMTRLRADDRTFFSFDIGKPSNLKPLVARINKESLSIEPEGQPRSKIDLFMGDIKQMFTELPHDELKMAVDWLISRFTARYGAKVTLRVRKRLKKNPEDRPMNVVLGSSCVSNKRYYNISMIQLRGLIHFDIDNVFFKVGSHVYRQFKGIPMGSNPSPALAYLICTYYERRIPKTTPVSRLSRIFGARYMDDILIIRLLPPNDVTMSKLLDDDLMRITDTSHADAIYHSDLKIKRETDPRGVLCLGTLLYLRDNGTLAIRYQNKNEDSLLRRQRQIILRFQHFRSYSPKTTKIGTIIGEITRILALTSLWDDVLSQVDLLLKELCSIGYPKRLISQAIKNKINRSFCPKWRALLTFIDTLT